MQIIKKLLNKRSILFILIIGVAVGILNYGYTMVVRYNIQSMSLTLNYEGANKGLNPDGSRFNVYEMMSDEVIENAIKKTSIQGMEVGTLKDRIDIVSKMPYNITQKIKNANAEQIDYTYIPTTFIISYSQKDKLSRNHTIELLTALSEAYKEYFFENYTDKNVVLNYESYKDTEYEYLEIGEMYQSKIDAMRKYIESEYNKNQAYKSEISGETFGNILTMLNNVESVQLEKYTAYVTMAAVAKDRDVYIKKLEYARDSYRRSYNKSYSAQQFTEGALNKYDPRITSVIFIPALDEENRFYMNRTQTGLDYLVKNAHEHGIEAENMMKYIDRYEYMIKSMSKVKGASSPESIEQTKSMLEAIDTRLKEICDIAITTDNDYLEYKTKDYLNFVLPQRSWKEFINIPAMMRGGILGILLGIAFMLGKIIYPDMKKKVAPKLKKWKKVFNKC